MKHHGTPTMELGLELGLRLAAGYEVTVEGLRRDFGVSRATAYRIRSKIIHAQARRGEVNVVSKLCNHDAAWDAIQREHSKLVNRQEGL